MAIIVGRERELVNYKSVKISLDTVYVRLPGDGQKPDRILCNYPCVRMYTISDIDDLDAMLQHAQATMGAAEAHGALCGMLCARGATGLSEWMQHVLGEHAQTTAMHDLTAQLSQLHRHTLEQINDAVAGFYLLLPDDGAHLSVRVDALASWCQGFIYGLAAGGISSETQLPADSRELLLDIIESSRAGPEIDTEDAVEADEIAFIEISEYVRTGVLLINEELQPLKTARTLQ